MLNELEFVDGYVYANVWYSSYILKIDPDSGLIVNKWNIKTLADAEHAYQAETNMGYVEADVQNGIAYNRSRGTFYLSGKKHHLIFEVNLN